jgi:two-component system sensor histidine kinase QseC
VSRRHRSLAARLTLVQIAVFALLWLLVVAATIYSTYESGDGDIDTELVTRAESLARFMPDPPTPLEAQRVGAALLEMELLHADPPLLEDEFAYQVWTAEGKLLARSAEQPALPALPPGSSTEGLAEREGWYAQVDQQSSSATQVVVAKRVSYYERRVRDTVGQLVVLWLVLAVLSALAFWWTFRFVIRPLRTLAARVSARESNDLSPVDGADAFREVLPLIEALNEKLARIRALLEAERRFFADAAHELRTPLSAIGAQAHVLAHEPDAAARLASLRQIEGGIERGARVIAKLLALGKLEGADARIDRQLHDVTAIGATIVDAMRARAERKNQVLRLASPDPVETLCDAEQIAVLIENLVENALLYCPAGSSVEVHVSRHGAQVQITVSDDGPGIAAEDRARAFGRFQRIGAPDATGSGLGLAIVKRIAALHGGDATIGDGANGRGTRVTVTLAD